VFTSFKVICEQSEHFSNISVHKTQKTAKACGVHHSTVFVVKVCSKALILHQEIKYLLTKESIKKKM
jgi:hypothetical protein